MTYSNVNKGEDYFAGDMWIESRDSSKIDVTAHCFLTTYIVSKLGFFVTSVNPNGNKNTTYRIPE